jgi:hypothetical protein
MKSKINFLMLSLIIDVSVSLFLLLFGLQFIYLYNLLLAMMISKNLIFIYFFQRYNIKVYEIIEEIYKNKK